MEYENPKIPEGINVGKEHPLKDFALLAAAALGAVVLVVVLLAWSAEYAARFIPFGVEQVLASKFADSFVMGKREAQETLALQRYLETLTDRIALAEALPQEMTLTVHFIDDDTLNAFAMLGGHIFIYRGLLERMPNENALAMVIAHEIAHVKHRDPIVALGRGVTLSVALASVAGLADSGLLQWVLNQAGLFTALKFSRSQEEAADDAALEALVSIYGHVQGAEALFEVLQGGSGLEPPAFYSTHPVTEDRIEKIKKLAGNRGSAQLTPLPSFNISGLEEYEQQPEPGR